MKLNYYIKAITLAIVCSTGILFTSCDNDDDDDDYIYAWGTVELSPRLQNPGITNRSETGIVSLSLIGNMLYYDLRVNNLASTDNLTMAHFHSGDPLTNGPVILDFMPTFDGNKAKGSVFVRQSLVDSLLDNSKEIYFNVHSEELPNGLVRGQVNSDIILAEDIALSGLNEIPPVITTATGVASLRLTKNNVLYSKVVVNNIEPTDEVTMSQIHTGSVTESGPVLVTLSANEDELGIIKRYTLDDATANTVTRASTYVNVHSTLRPSGIIRGQLND